MKFSKMNLKYVIILMASVALFSCSKAEDGAIGPIGPAGIAGQNGIDGVDGADGLNGGVDGVDGTNGTNGADGADGAVGADGSDGNANVVWSQWTPVQFNQTPQKFVSFSIDNPIFTEINASTAAVFAYGRIIGGDGTVNVYSIPRTAGVKSYYFNMHPGSERILFQGETIDKSNQVFDDFENVRYVVIPAFFSGKKSGPNVLSQIKAAGVDMNNYTEVANYFGLSD